MTLHQPTENKMEYVLQAANSRTSLSFPQASSGNPGGIRTGPPIKTFGGDDLGESHLLTSAAIFEGDHEVKIINLNLVAFVFFLVRNSF
jgi:hypothetical protein